jgi:rod shape-determining protein MreC
MIRMFDRTRRLRLLLAVLIMASVTIITVDFRSGGDGPLDKVGRAAMTVLEPIQSGLVTIFRPVGNFFAGFTQVPSLRTRVQELEGELATLAADREQFEDVLRENESLRALVAITERFGFRTRAAQVIGVGASNFEQTVFISLGSDDGIEVDTPVIAGGGVVGRVVRVARSSSHVVLLTDRSSSVAGRVSATGQTGIVDGQGSRRLSFELLNPESRVSVGDTVVTSGYDGGLFPPGIPIGTVTEAPEAGPNLSRVVTVEPLVDFSSLDHVLLVLSERPQKRGRR